MLPASLVMNGRITRRLLSLVVGGIVATATGASVAGEVQPYDPDLPAAPDASAAPAAPPFVAVPQRVDAEPPLSNVPQRVDRERPPRRRPPRAPETPEVQRSTAIYGIQGLGAPVGVFGLEIVHRFGTFFELAGGVGIGLSANSSTPNPSLGHELQWSVMPRLRLGNDHSAFTLGLGVSGGQYGGFDFIGVGPGCDDDGCTTYSTRYALWGNLEIGGEHWTRRGFAIRYFVGLAQGEALSPQSDSINGQRLLIPYTGLGLGYAF